ncbi:DUF5412 family protein [Lysinibacillus fusiformis]
MGGYIFVLFRGELVFNQKGNKTKNIYWNNRKGTAKKYLDDQ